MSDDTNAAEMALYADLAPRMLVECPGCGGAGVFCGECRTTGKVAPLISLLGARELPVYALLYGAQTVPLGLVLDLAARMGLMRNVMVEAWGPGAFTAYIATHRNGYKQDAPTTTMAVLRALTAAVEAKP